MKLRQTDQNNEELKSLAERIFFIDGATGNEINIPYVYDEDKKTITIYFNNNARKYMSFFDEKVELPKDASEELINLRTQYFKELEDLKSRPQGCSTCAQNSLKRKYTSLIQKFYR